jgi:hypothetical protein
VLDTYKNYVIGREPAIGSILRISRGSLPGRRLGALRNGIFRRLTRESGRLSFIVLSRLSQADRDNTTRRQVKNAVRHSWVAFDWCAPPVLGAEIHGKPDFWQRSASL